MKPATVSASLAVISTASKYLHNDLARAIEALEQKKSTRGTSFSEFCDNCQFGEIRIQRMSNVPIVVKKENVR